jgi:hypothetical protein
MTRAMFVAIGLAAGVAAVALTSTPAAAQMAAALGKPLPSPDLPVGTVTVRIVAGSAAAPVVGTDVTLIVNDTPRVARTDSAGRASFAGLPVGAQVVAKVLDEDKAEHASDAFPIPAAGGVRLMITTKPWQAGAGGGGGAPFAGGGGGGMPSPRQVSGEPRGEQSDPPGTITVRVAYDDFKDTPEGTPVALIGYVADDSITTQVVNTDKEGRAVFSGLDRSSATSYFAMTLVPRNGGFDRLYAGPMVLEAQTGVRLVLSSEKRDSRSPAIDDYGKNDPQGDTPAGKVRVALEGVADLSAKVTLFDVATKRALGEARPEASPPDPSRVQAGSQFVPDDKLPAGTLDVEVVGGAGQDQEPLKDVAIRVMAAGSHDPTSGLLSSTGADGTVRMAVKASEPQKAVFVINGRAMESQPFDLARSGGKLMVRARWEATGRPQAVFDFAGTPGQVVYAECEFKGQRYRSLPAQLIAAAGTKLTAYVYPRTLFQFSIDSAVNDARLDLRGRFQVHNYSWSPYRAGPDGLVVPMPRGFRDASVDESDQAEVSVAQGEGFRLIRPIPPGGRAFHGSFRLPVDHGNVNWSLDLPMGAFQSEVHILKTPGMKVNVPPGVDVDTRTVQAGDVFMIGPISIRPQQSMAMTLEGLPMPPAWRTVVPLIVGLLVIVVIGGGIGYALLRKPGAPADAAAVAREARRQALLDELVGLERDGGDRKRREQVLSELEGLWG